MHIMALRTSRTIRTGRYCAIVLAVSMLPSTFAQPCAESWWSGFSGGDFDGWVNALAEFDPDGPGPNPPYLFAGGQFGRAGGQPIEGLARWNGATWTRVFPPSFSGTIRDMVV